MSNEFDAFANLFGNRPLMKTDSTMKTVESFGTCPACKKPVMGNVLWEVAMDKGVPADNRVAHLKPIGADVAHRCSPDPTPRTVNKSEMV